MWGVGNMGAMLANSVGVFCLVGVKKGGKKISPLQLPLGLWFGHGLFAAADTPLHEFDTLVHCLLCLWAEVVEPVE